ncbi:MAG: YciI family protein [Pyrinomonadaceae bacterium]|nr:YciI family protein [Pyrinomonadaceae bacterium]
MKFKLVFAALAISILSLVTYAQEAPKVERKPNPIYDAELAKKLGGSEGGMRSYVFALLKTGPYSAKATDEERKKLQAGHMESIGRWAKDGKLAVAGPFGKNDQNYRGIYIFAVSTIEEAQSLASEDPAIKAGIFVLEYTPWYGSASLMATPEIHNKITKYID